MHRGIIADFCMIPNKHPSSQICRGFRMTVDEFCMIPNKHPSSQICRGFRMNVDEVVQIPLAPQDCFDCS